MVKLSDRPDALLETIKLQNELIATLEDALNPFAKFAEAMTRLGGTYPQTGEVYVIRSGGDPVALTVENFKAAAAALSD